MAVFATLTDGSDALYWACMVGLNETATLLCSPIFLQDVNKLGEIYNTALQAASYHGYKEIVQTLIASGVEVNCEGGRCNTALHAAALCGNQEIVDMLIVAHADVESEGVRYGTALITAAFCGHSSIVSKLLDTSISTRTLNFKSTYQGTALEAAALKGHKRIVEKLLEAGADHGNAVMEAAKKGHEEIVSLFIKQGAALNIRYSRSREYEWPNQTVFTSHESDHPASQDTISLLEHVVLNGSDNMVKEILQAGATTDQFFQEKLTIVVERGFRSSSCSLKLGPESTSHAKSCSKQ